MKLIDPLMPVKLIALMSVLMLGEAALAQATGSSPDDPVVASKEYFVQQQAGEAVVVRISPMEAQYIARASSESGDVSIESGLPDARMLPVFQFFVVNDAPRQLTIEVEATQTTNRTGFELGLTRLNVRDDRSAGIARAYRLLSDGLEVMPDGSTPDWTVKVQTLLRAASLFQDIGIEELRLWSATLAAHLILHRMGDYQAALAWANELLADPRISRYPEIAFAVTKIRSSAMVDGRIETGGADPMTSGLQQTLQATIQSARSLGYALEEALALKASGMDLLDQGRHRQAMQQFNAALDIATRIEAGDLAAEIREFMVDIHAQAGNLDASGDVLQDIETHLALEGDEQELATNLLRQGRFLIESYRFRDAIAVLSRATEFEQSSLSRLEAELALGQALSANGQNEQALVHLYRGVLQPESGGFRRPTPALDIDAALEQIAAIHRYQGNWDEVREIRSAQSRFISAPSDSAYLSYQKALDSLRRNGVSSAQTSTLYQQAVQQAGASGLDDIQVLARLGSCVLLETGAAPCDAASMNRDFESIRETGSAKQLAHAALYYSQSLARQGRISRAFSVLDEQLDQLTTSGYQSLGAWHWQWRETLIGQYLGMAIRLEQDGKQGGAWNSFLALAKARNFERGNHLHLVRHDAKDIQSFVQGLPPGTVILTFYIGPDQAHAWIAGRSEVRRFSLSDSGRVSTLIEDTRAAIQTGSWGLFDELREQLGAVLIAPIAAELTSTVLLVSHGELLGLPLDTLSAGGSAMITGHQFIQLDALPPVSADFMETPFPSPSSTFLAGDPRDWTGEFASRLEVSAEVKTVSDQFVGPGLHTVQGVSLLNDEFQDQRYGQADLIHLSVPGIVDLSPARNSGLFLSEPTRGEGRQQLDSALLANLPNRARLVFMSRTEFSGTGQSLENRLGLISSILDAGADAVIASLWPLEPEARRRFVADFYQHLAVEQNILAALTLTKRNLAQGRPTQDWAGFQLFFN